jgi:magnesium chelatase family protein
MVATARMAGLKHVYVPAEDAAEAALLDGLEVVPTPSLADLVAHCGVTSRCPAQRQPI